MTDVINDALSVVVDYMYNYVLIFILIGAGVYFFIRTKGLPITMLAESIRVVREKPHDAASISSFRALMLSTASRVGIGNIAGVAVAIALGGTGAVFWMWTIALLGAASAFVESTLAQIYKRRAGDGHSYGGPAYYIDQALKMHWLGLLFAVFLILTYVGGFNLVASYNIKDSFVSYGFFSEMSTTGIGQWMFSTFGENAMPYTIGLIMAVLMLASIIGGTKRLSIVTAVLVPAMALFYLLFCFILIAVNITHVPAVFAEIFRSAFDFTAIFGGFAGSAMMLGIKRGLYSNEAGVGSAPNAAATASVSHPVKQGLVQMLSVWIDTLVICTATALSIMATGVEGSEDLKGPALVQAAWATLYGDSFGYGLVTAAIFIFGFTTLIGNYFYAEANLGYILGRDPKQVELIVFRIVSATIVFVGAVAEFDLAWNMADVLMGLMVLINIPTIVVLGGRALAALEDYRQQRLQGADPVYVAKNNGIAERVDYWQ